MVVVDSCGCPRSILYYQAVTSIAFGKTPKTSFRFYWGKEKEREIEKSYFFSTPKILNVEIRGARKSLRFLL